MANRLANAQRLAFLALLDEVISILRDNKPLNPENPVFGEIKSTDTGPEGAGHVYRYKNNAIPSAKEIFTTQADPLDYSEDRTKVRAVPSYFHLYFFDSITGISRTEMEERLDLADFRPGPHGEKVEGNCYPAPPPAISVLICRYRANERIDSRYPVNVEFVFNEPSKDNPLVEPALASVTIERAYPVFSPGERKQQREEESQRARHR